MNVGITGSHGFIGTHLYNRLIKSQHNLNISICERFDRAKHNLLKPDSLEPFVGDKDVIFHLAGVNRTHNNDFIAINALGTLNLLEAIRRFSGANKAKIVFASSLQVYGFTSKSERLKESASLNPTNMYGMSKKFAEEIIHRYCEDYGVHGIILRISNVYGPRCRPFYNSVIPTFIFLTLKKRPLIIHGSGESSRDFIYVNDVVQAFIKVIQHKLKSPSVFNVCTGLATSLNRVVEKISKMMGNVRVIYERNGDDNFLIGNPSRTRKVLGFKSEMSLDGGLKETLKWFKGSKNEFRD